MSDLERVPATSFSDSSENIVELDHVVKHFSVHTNKVFRRANEFVHAVDDVSLSIRRGETLGLVGETGCGKSTLARCITRLVNLTSGSVRFGGADISRLSPSKMRPYRREMQMVFQDPYGSLNPRRRVGSIIGDPFAIHKTSHGEDRKEKVQHLMALVGLNPEHYNRFPAEFSGGQRQRIGVGARLALSPQLIVADEPVSALDVSIQAQVLNLLSDVQEEFHLTYLFIAHDLSVVRHVSDRVAVMYLGKIVELAGRDDLYDRPRHPYTKALQSALPVTDPDEADRRHRVVLGGDVPSPISPPSGCRFHERCPKAQAICSEQEPPLAPALGDPLERLVACHFPLADGEELPEAGGGDRRALRHHCKQRELGRVVIAGPHVPQVEMPSGDVAEVSSAIRGRSPWQLAIERLRHDRVAVISAIVIVLIIVMALDSPLVAHLVGHGPDVQYRETGLSPEGIPVGPGRTFLLGTDELGRDILVRIFYGARISLLAGVVASVLTVAVGVLVGMLAGYLGGVVDMVLARMMDVVLSLPYLVFAIALVARVGPSLTVSIAVIAFFSFSAVGRIVRGQVLSIKEKEYIEAARSLGAGNFRIMFIDVLPNVLAPVIVYLTLLIPLSIVFEATLSFLGLGIVPPTPDWGGMLAESISYYQVAWWYVAFPGLALLTTTLAFNLLGDSVRDAFDPRNIGFFDAE